MERTIKNFAAAATKVQASRRFGALLVETRMAVTKKDKLPAEGLNTHYIIARENYYFVYPTNYHEYERQYRGTFQHGGISMEEMILPCVVMNPRR